MNQPNTFTPVGKFMIMHGGRTKDTWLVLGPKKEASIRPTIASGRFVGGTVEVVFGAVGPDVLQELQRITETVCRDKHKART